MKKSTLPYWLLFCTVLFITCQTSRQAKDTVAIKLTSLDDGYFLKNDVALQDDISCMVITAQTMLDNYFGYGAVMGATNQVVDFSNNYVVAVVAQPSNVETKLVFAKAELINGDLSLDIKIEQGEKLTYEANAIALATVSRSEKINTVLFYSSDMLIRKIEL